MKKGTVETKAFYDSVGWTKTREGSTVDNELFGVLEDGPIRIGLHALRWRRILDRLEQNQSAERVLEVGCGGAPEPHIVGASTCYTGIDFSSTGIQRAKESLEDSSTPYELLVGDACNLPFDNASFDAVYSAHMIYHIVDPAAQAQALSEMTRVTRPGGLVVLVTANPRPVLFPARAAIRMVAERKRLRAFVERFRPTAPVPYNPQRTRWTRNQLSQYGTVDVFGFQIASTSFNRKVSEEGSFGQIFWRGVEYLERNHPKASARLGNYVCMICRVKDHTDDL